MAESVSLPLDPDEAKLLYAFLLVMGQRIEATPDGIVVVQALARIRARIALQLEALARPLDARKRAPYPV